MSRTFIFTARCPAGCEPTVKHDDYAKWMLDDPRVNFAISNRSAQRDFNHLGIQAEDDQELQVIKQRLDATQQPVETREQAACCYMRSDKYWKPFNYIIRESTC